MTKITIRNLDEETKDALRYLAARRRHSMEAEIRDILRQSVKGLARPAPLPCPPEEKAPLAANRAAPAAPDPEDPNAAKVRKMFADMNRQFEELGLGTVELPEILQLK